MNIIRDDIRSFRCVRRVGETPRPVDRLRLACENNEGPVLAETAGGTTADDMEVQM